MSRARMLVAAAAALALIVFVFLRIPTLELDFALPPGTAQSEKPEVDIVFGGDMLFDRSVRTYAEKYGEDYLFQCLDPLFGAVDLVVANLEGPITSNPSTSQFSEPGDGNNYTFTFPLSTAKLLFDHHVRLVSIGNNHIMNFGRAGLLETKTALSAAGVEYFGDPDSLEQDRVARLAIRGVPLSFINWSDWTSDNTDITAAQVRAEVSAGRVVVVYAHWGEEYVPPPERVKRLAHSLVDAGASLVVGSHPHIVQEHETYRGVPIYYSLGNLIFDQYWEDAVSHGLLLRVQLGKRGVVSLEEIPVVLQRNRQTCPLVKE